jgi:hypothetical protein
VHSKNYFLAALLACMAMLGSPANPAAAGGFSDANWVNVGTGMNLFVYSTVIDPSGNLYAGGNFTSAGGVSANYIAKWNGTSWTGLGSGMNSWVLGLASDGFGNIYAGGYFTRAAGSSANYIAKWNGTNWSALGQGLDNWVLCVASDSAGNLYAGGVFANAGGVAANCVAKWNGTNWSALGTGLTVGGYTGGYVPQVESLALDRAGNLYAGGYFTSAGGVSASCIAKWDGTNWSPLGSGADSLVDSLLSDNSGNLYAGGQFANIGGVNANYIAKWDGANWFGLGSGVQSGGLGLPVVASLAMDACGNLYAGGNFTNASGASADCMAKWNGQNWLALGSGVNTNVYCMVCDSYGNLWVGGAFSRAGTNASAYLAKALLAGPTLNMLTLTQSGPPTNVVNYLGTPGQNYALDLATSLTPPVAWMPQTTNMTSASNAVTSGYLTFTNVGPSPQGFYRTRLVP